MGIQISRLITGHHDYDGGINEYIRMNNSCFHVEQPPSCKYRCGWMPTSLPVRSIPKVWRWMPTSSSISLNPTSLERRWASAGQLGSLLHHHLQILKRNGVNHWVIPATVIHSFRFGPNRDNAFVSVVKNGSYSSGNIFVILCWVKGGVIGQFINCLLLFSRRIVRWRQEHAWCHRRCKRSTATDVPHPRRNRCRRPVSR